MKDAGGVAIPRLRDSRPYHSISYGRQRRDGPTKLPETFGAVGTPRPTWSFSKTSSLSLRVASPSLLPNPRATSMYRVSCDPAQITRHPPTNLEVTRRPATPGIANSTADSRF